MTKNKALVFSILGALVLVSFLGFASAAITVSGIPVLSETTGTHSATITITSDKNETVTFTGLANIVDADGKVINFTLPSPITTIAGTPQTVTISYSVPEEFKFKETDSATLVSTGSVNPAVSQTLSFGFALLEGYSDNGNLRIDDVDVFVENGFGDDTEWYPLDEIRVSVDISNNANDEIRNIVVEWGLYDKKNARWVVQDEESDFDLDEDDERTVEFTFKLDKMSRLETDGDYFFYVWATGNDKETSNKTSTFSSLAIDVTIDSHLVILDSLEIVGTPSCGETVQIKGDVWNIGDDDENDVYLKVFNTELGVSQTVNVGDIDSFESKDLLFNLVLPEDAEEGKSYDIGFLVYDDSDDIFESSNGDQARFTLPVTIASGSCSAEVPATVFANLESEPKVGQEFQVRTTITNTASTRKTFNVEIGSYSSWATLVSLDKSSVTLDAASAGDVVVTLKPNEGVSGSQTFNIVLKEGTKILTQPVSVSVARPGFSFTGWISGLGLGGNAYLWVIGALNVILVLIIIVVAVRVVRKK